MSIVPAYPEGRLFKSGCSMLYFEYSKGVSTIYRSKEKVSIEETREVLRYLRKKYCHTCRHRLGEILDLCKSSNNTYERKAE